MKEAGTNCNLGNLNLGQVALEEVGKRSLILPQLLEVFVERLEAHFNKGLLV